MLSYRKKQQSFEKMFEWILLCQVTSLDSAVGWVSCRCRKNSAWRFCRLGRIVQKSAVLPTFRWPFWQRSAHIMPQFGACIISSCIVNGFKLDPLPMPMISQDISHRDSPSAVPPGVSTNVMHLHLSNGMCAYLHGWYLPFQWYPPTVLHRVPYSVLVVVSVY